MGVVLLGTASPASAQWPIGTGNFWAKVSWFHHETTEQFRSNGEKRIFLNSNAVSVSDAIFLDVAVGVTDKLDLWVQAPYFDLNFDDDVQDRHRAGVGDVRVSARYNLASFRGGSWPVSARVTAKVPIQSVTVDAEVIPVGEGQWDYEAWLESGLSLYPLPAYTVVWLGYRRRTLNTTTTRDPGDEVAFLAELGGTELFGGLGGKVVVDGIFGRAGRIQGVALGPDDRREILYVAPTALFNVTSSTLLEVALRIPLRGRNYPAGPPLQVGLFHQGSLFR